MHRNIGISTSSTTSRSTAKTSSSPYRSDYGESVLRVTNTSTSTSERHGRKKSASGKRSYGGECYRYILFNLGNSFFCQAFYFQENIRFKILILFNNTTM